MSNVTYVGHKISNDELKIHPKKVKAALNIREPDSKEKLRGLLGVINDLSMYIPLYQS